jgi:hypothetical protein
LLIEQIELAGFCEFGPGVSKRIFGTKKPIRATVAKEAGQGMSTEETTATRTESVLNLTYLPERR